MAQKVTKNKRKIGGLTGCHVEYSVVRLFTRGEEPSIELDQKGFVSNESEWSM